jgi:hypothetical protein
VDSGRRFTFYNDLWAFDGSTWQPLGESGEKISGVRLAWDAARRRVVSFGGYSGRPRGELRVLEGDRWGTPSPLAAMPVAEPGFVYDVRRDRLVAFGGATRPGRAAGETWEHDGTAWAKFAGPSPPARQAHAMVFDEQRARTVLFGGMGESGPGQAPPSFGETWEFDGTVWVKHEAPGPSPRHSAGAAYDARRGLVILFGGLGADGFLGDTWAWNGAAWTKLAERGPEPRAMGQMAYDKRRDRIVLFGGRNGWPDGDLNDTWEWDGSAWKRVGN